MLRGFGLPTPPIKGQNEQRGLFDMPAVLGRKTTKTFALNGVINPLGQWRFFIDAWIQPTFTIAAYIVLGSGSGNFGAAAALKRTMSPAGFPINADLKKTGEVRATFLLDAVRLRMMSSGVWVDAYLAAKPFPTFTIDALVAGTVSRSLALDAYIRADDIVIYPEDGIGTITVISGGSGYTDTPTLVFGGPGEGAVAVPIVTNASAQPRVEPRSAFGNSCRVY